MTNLRPTPTLPSYTYIPLSHCYISFRLRASTSLLCFSTLRSRLASFSSLGSCANIRYNTLQQTKHASKRIPIYFSQKQPWILHVDSVVYHTTLRYSCTPCTKLRRLEAVLQQQSSICRKATIGFTSTLVRREIEATMLGSGFP